MLSFAKTRAKSIAPTPEKKHPKRLMGPTVAKLEGSKKTPDPIWLPITKDTIEGKDNFLAINTYVLNIII